MQRISSLNKYKFRNEGGGTLDINRRHSILTVAHKYTLFDHHCIVNENNWFFNDRSCSVNDG